MNPTSSELLSKYFERKKISRSGFSLRNFAKLLKVSPSFASGMMQGKKTIPISRIEELTKVLDLDDLAKNELLSTLTYELLQKNGLTSSSLGTARSKASRKYKLAPKSQISILKDWYFVAILDLTTCANFQKDSTWIAAKLGISKFQVEHALQQLQQFGVLKETANGYKKIQSKLRLAFNESQSDIRKFHSQMMDKAKEELLSKTSIEDFQKREITGITIAANPRNVKKARLRLIEALHEVADILSEGETTELYQINAQLFTLLKK